MEIAYQIMGIARHVVGMDMSGRLLDMIEKCVHYVKEPAKGSVMDESYTDWVNAMNRIDYLEQQLERMTKDRDYYKELAQMFHDAVHKEAQRRAGVEI